MVTRTSQHRSPFLRKCRLQALDFWENGAGAAGAEALAAALHGQTSLVTLELRGNGMGDAGARAFARMMPKNAPLGTLDLLNNSISSEGRSSLQAGLASSSANPYLVLFEDFIGPHQQHTSWEAKGRANAP